MRVKKNVLQKIISVFASILLLVNSFTPYLYSVAPVYSQSVAEEIQSKIEFNNNKNEFKISVNTKAEVEYILSYQTDKQTEAISGKAEKSEKNFERALYAGTCSENGTCVKHNVLRGILKTKISLLDWLSSKKFIFENGSLIISKDEVSTTLDLTDNETNWLSNGGNFVPEGDILDGISVSNSWNKNVDSSFTSKNIVSINTEYIAPFNNNLTIKFTKLPENPSKVTIKEIPASFDLGEDEQVGSVYEITSEMQDGEFTYDLSLPVPDGSNTKNLEVKYAESVDELKNSNYVNQETIVNEESLTVKNLDHFTVFVITSPSISSVDTTGIAWVNTGNIYTSNNSRANSTINLGQITKNLIATGFGNSIPAGASIEGIEVNIEKGVDVSRTNAIKDYSVRLFVDGNIVGDNKALGSYFNNTTDAITTYGSSTDMWGISLTSDQINSNNFGVSYSAQRHTSGSSDQKVRIDHIQIKVYYSPDTTEPETTIDSGPSGSVNSTNADFYFSSNETSTFECSLNGGEFSSCSSPQSYSSLNDGTHTFDVRAIDSALNTDSTPASATWTVDTQAPTSTFESPTDDSFWNTPINIQGSSTDIPNTTVDYVTLYYSETEADDWYEITQISNDELEEPFNWSYNWEPEDGERSYDIMAEATDTAGNTENSPVVYNVTYDITSPSTPGAPTTTTPTSNNTPAWDWEASIDTNFDYYLFFWDTIAGGETNNSGNISSNLFTIPLALLDGTWYGKVKAYDKASNESDFSGNGLVLIDTTAPTTPQETPAAGDYTTDQSVTLESSDLGSGLAAIYYTLDGSTPDNSSTEYTGSITVDQDMTIKAIAYDNVGNVSGILEAVYGIAPIISSETSSSVTSTTTTITWTTDDLSTSRVIYDTVSHANADPSFDDPLDKYGYANTTDEFDASPKVTDHSVDLSGLTAGTTYYYRSISHGSPDAVSGESSFTTSASTTSTGTVAGASTGGNSTPTCSDTKPGSAPSGLSAVGGLNSVTLTWNKANDPVSYYLVTYGLSSGSQAFGNPNVGNSSTTSYTVSNLSGGITYYFKVRAGNGCAPGEFSSEVSATPTGGFVEGPAAGFAPGVLGAATEEAKLKEEVENKQTLGKFTQTIKQKTFIKYLPFIAILLIVIFIFLKRKRMVQ